MHPRTGPIRILLIEDSPGDARLIQEYLRLTEDSTYAICHVLSIADAETHLRLDPTSDVILLDLMLPDAQGLDSFTRVHDAAPQVPIVVLTGMADERLALEALRAGAQDYLPKEELTERVLSRVIRYAIERSHRELAVESAQRREHLLAEAGRILMSPTRLSERLRELAGLLIPRVADCCIIDVLREDGTLHSTEVAAVEPAMKDQILGYLERRPTGAGEATSEGWALGPGEPIFVREAASEPVEETTLGGTRKEMIDLLDPDSWMVVPMKMQDQVFGAMTLIACESGRHFSPSDLSLAKAVGRRAALAVYNARLYRDAREARDRMRRLQDVTAALSGAVTREAVADVVLREGIAALHAVGGGVATLCDDGKSLELLGVEGFPDLAPERWERFSVDDPVPLAEAARTGSLVLADGAEFAARYPDLVGGRSAEVHSWIAAPLLLEERSVGAIALGFEEPRSVLEPDRELLVAIANQCAQAMERARLYEREQRAVRQRDEVLGVVAHDLRNPLSAIEMYAFLLSEETVSDELRLRHSEGIHKLARQMERMIRDLLDLSQIEAGQLKIDPDRTPLSAILSDAEQTLRGKAAAAGVELVVGSVAGLPPVHADYERAVQILSNLGGNAIRFTPRGGTVTLGAKLLGSEVEIAVADTGRGIQPEDLEHIFERYWQSPSTRRGGAGLGLSIVKGIVEAHGGQLRAESAPGRGSTFYFTLPVAAEPEDPARPPRAAAIPVQRRERPPSVERSATGAQESSASLPGDLHLSVLVVDDHPAVRRGLLGILRDVQGVDVVGEASTGSEAIESVKMLRPDVVLMDLQLPGMGGVEATARIHEIDPSVRVIALTAEPQEAMLLKVIEAGGSGYVQKIDAHEQLVPALMAAARSELLLPSSGAYLLLEGYRSAMERRSPLGDLSEREREILRLVAEGFTSKEIGKRLYLSPHTVDSYRSDLMKRHGFEHRAEIVRFALRTGLLTAEESATE